MAGDAGHLSIAQWEGLRDIDSLFLGGGNTDRMVIRPRLFPIVTLGTDSYPISLESDFRVSFPLRGRRFRFPFMAELTEYICLVRFNLLGAEPEVGIKAVELTIVCFLPALLIMENVAACTMDGLRYQRKPQVLELRFEDSGRCPRGYQITASGNGMAGSALFLAPLEIDRIERLLTHLQGIGGMTPATAFLKGLNTLLMRIFLCARIRGGRQHGCPATNEEKHACEQPSP